MRNLGVVTSLIGVLVGLFGMVLLFQEGGLEETDVQFLIFDLSWLIFGINITLMGIAFILFDGKKK